MLAVKRSNESRRISWEGEIGEVKDGELWNMLVGGEKLNFHSFQQKIVKLATKPN